MAAGEEEKEVEELMYHPAKGKATNKGKVKAVHGRKCHGSNKGSAKIINPNAPVHIGSSARLSQKKGLKEKEKEASKMDKGVEKGPEKEEAWGKRLRENRRRNLYLMLQQTRAVKNDLVDLL